MLTEREARQKVCPYLPIEYISEQIYDGAIARRVEAFARCIASDCMAWRWSGWQNGEVVPGGYNELEPPTLEKGGFHVRP